MAMITEREAQEISAANASGLPPVVFVHGLWLLPSSWDRWQSAFQDAGYATLAPSWPDDPDTVQEANAHPELLAHKSVGQVAARLDDVVRQLHRKPAIVGHSFRG